MTGTEIIRQGADILRAAGFVVRVFNANRRVRTRNWIDVWACKDGVSWLIEAKGQGDRIRPGQREFYRQLSPHLGDGVRYLLAQSVEDIEDIVTASRYP